LTARSLEQGPSCSFQVALELRHWLFPVMSDNFCYLYRSFAIKVQVITNIKTQKEF
jgi:hypothetical protein